MRHAFRTRLAGTLTLCVLLTSFGAGSVLAADAQPPTAARTVLATIGTGSCVGTDACTGATGDIGDNACNGPTACKDSTGNISSNSCNANDGCYGAAGNVGANSCNSLAACSATVGIGTNSCTGFFACANADSAIGNSSCNGNGACLELDGTVGANSCNGDHSCDHAIGGVGTNSCNGVSWPCDYVEGNIGDCANNDAGFEPAACLATLQPDAWIRRLGGPVRGNDVFNSTGVHQTAKLKMYLGDFRVANITIENEGNAADSFTVGANAGSVAGFDIRYFAGREGPDITTAVENGTFETPVLAPGEVYRVRVKAKVSTAAPRDSKITRLVTITSVIDGSMSDTVRYTVKRV